MGQEIAKYIFCLSAGFMLAFSGALIWEYYKGKRLDRRYVAIALASCLAVIVTNQ